VAITRKARPTSSMHGARHDYRRTTAQRAASPGPRDGLAPATTLPESRRLSGLAGQIVVAVHSCSVSWADRSGSPWLGARVATMAELWSLIDLVREGGEPAGARHH
jgi:hypothetical protein